jgi:hypothetical protein
MECRRPFRCISALGSSSDIALATDILRMLPLVAHCRSILRVPTHRRFLLYIPTPIADSSLRHARRRPRVLRQNGTKHSSRNRHAPNATVGHAFESHEQSGVLFTLVRALNCQKKYEEGRFSRCGCRLNHSSSLVCSLFSQRPPDLLVLCRCRPLYPFSCPTPYLVPHSSTAFSTFPTRRHDH